jgi:hypothetical protein
MAIRARNGKRFAQVPRVRIMLAALMALLALLVALCGSGARAGARARHHDQNSGHKLPYRIGVKNEKH